MYNIFGDNMYNTNKLKALRQKNNYTMEDMSNKLNITAAYYCLIEHRKRTLYYDLAVKIADIFNMRPDDIFYTK